MYLFHCKHFKQISLLLHLFPTCIDNALLIPGSCICNSNLAKTTALISNLPHKEKPSLSSRDVERCYGNLDCFWWVCCLSGNGCKEASSARDLHWEQTTKSKLVPPHCGVQEEICTGHAQTEQACGKRVASGGSCLGDSTAANIQEWK